MMNDYNSLCSSLNTPHKRTWQKKIAMLLFFVMFSVLSVQGQVTVTSSGGNGTGNGSYTTLGAAFTALGTTATGAISISITGNTTEAVGGISLGAGTWTSITIAPSGGSWTVSGAATAGTPLVTFNGADNVTVNGGGNLTFSNTTSSTTSGTSTLKLISDATNNTFNNVIMQGAGSSATLGANTGIVWISTGTTTGNDNNSFQSCKFSGLTTHCVVANGSTTTSAIANSNVTFNNCEFYDYFVATGCSGIYASSGNTDWNITNNKFYQTTSRAMTGTMYGIFFSNSTFGNNLQVTGNTVGYASNSGTGTLTLTGTGVFTGINFTLLSSAATTSNVNSNIISDISFTSGSGAFTGINNSTTASGNTININSNTVRNIANIGSTGTMIGIQAGAATTLACSSNTVNNISRTVGGTFYGINYGSATAVTFNNNTISNLSSTSTTSTSALYGIYSGSSPVTETWTNNTISNISSSSTGAQTICGIYNNTATGTKTITGNTLTNFSLASSSTGTIYGIRKAFGGTTDNVSGNNVNTFSGGTNLYGINIASGTTNNVYNNKVYGLSSSVAIPAVYGIYVTSGTTNNVYNNIIGGLTTPAANTAIAIAGIYFSSGTTDNAYYNTVYLSGTSSGALFGSTALYASTTPTVDLRNNILVNACTANGATGFSTAYRRTGSTLTTYASTSNNNLLFGSTLYYDGTTAYAMAAYQTLVTPRDTASKNQNPTFASTTGSDATFLNFANGAINLAGGNAQVISGYTTDYAAATRSGSAPDMGAYEFAQGVIPAPTFTSFSPSAICVTGGQTITIIGTSLDTVSSVLFNGSGGITLPGTITGQTATSITVIAPANVVDGAIRVTNPTASADSASTFTAAPTPTIGVSSGSTVCASVASSLTATGASTYSWSPSTALSATTGDTVTASPTATTTYTVKGTSSAGCSATNTVTITVSPTPTALSVFKNPTAICYGGITTLTATGGQVAGSATAVLGAGASTSSTSGGSMFPGTYGGAKTQFIIKASELSAAGLVAGNITSLNFEATTAFSGYEGFALNIGHTAVSTASMPMITSGLTQVYSGAGTNGAYATTIGVNTLAFSSPFNWDGTSNIVLSFCWAKNPTATSTTSTTVKTDSPGFTCSVYGLKDSTIASTMCPFSASTDFGTSGTGTSRPKFTFAGTGLTNGSVVWTNTTDLYSNVGATAAYAGENLRTVYSKNTNAQTYTVSATIGSCSSTGSATVTPNALPTIAAGAATICAGGSGATLTATGGTTYAWSPSTGLSATTGASVTATPSTTTTYTVTGTDANGCINTTTSVVTVNNPVTIQTAPTSGQPANAVVLVGDPASFTVVATGTGLTYQWQENSGSGFGDISGAITATYTIATTTSGQNNNQYRCVVSGTAPCAPVTTSAATLTVGSLSITSQPVSQTICSDTSATFSIVASGDVASYQWQYSTNGTTWTDLVVTGADTASITLTGLTSASTGTQYHCVLNAGAVTSNPATVTVRDVVAIGTQPSNQSVCLGAASVTFTAAATGSGLTYQWQMSTNGTTWNDVSGATATTYTINTPSASLNNNQYKVIVTGTSPCSPVTSSVAVLTVTNVTVAASSASICIGGSTTLSATFTGAPDYTTTSWTSTTGSGAETAVSGTSATVTPTAAGTYVYTFASNGTCPFTKTVAVTVNALPVISSVTATPATVCSGANVSLTAASVTVATGSATIGAGATTSATYSNPFYSLWSNNHTQHLITVAELTAMGLSAGNITSVGLNVTSAGTLPMINLAVKIGTTSATAMTAFVSNTGFQTVYTSASLLPTTGVNTLTFSAPFYWNGTSNLVLEFCHGNSASSATMSRTVQADATSYVSTVKAQVSAATAAATTCADTTTNLLTYSVRPKFIFAGQVAANVASSYTWSWNSSPAVTAATGTTSVTNTSGAAVSQTFTATATTAAGCTNSLTTSAVSINSTIPTPTASNSTQCGTGTPTCSVTGTGISGSTFKWYLAATGGTALAGQTASTLSSYPVATLGDNFFYVSEVSADGLCESPRATVTVTVTAPFAFALNGTTATNCSGSASLTPIGIATNGGYTSYSWSNAATVSGNETTGWTFSPTSTTTYTLTATGGGCSTTASVVVTPTALPVVNVTAVPSSICVGASSTITALTSAVISGTVKVGTSTTTNTSSTGYPTAFGDYWYQDWQQYVFTAAELNALGLTAGNITSLNLDITALPSSAAVSNYNVKIGTTSNSTLSSFTTTGLTNVYGPASYTPVVGANTITFSAPYVWNGTSNIIVDIRGTGTYNTANAVTNYTTTTGNTVVYQYSSTDNTSFWTSSPTATTSTSRPNITFAGQKLSQGVGSLAYTWNDPAITSGNVLTVSPTSTTAYTVSGYNATTGCTGTATSTVTVYTPPTAPSVTNAIQCGTRKPLAAVADTNGYTTPVFKWYADDTTTTVLQASTSTTYTTSVSATTTFYVSVVSPGGCESPRTAITTTVVAPATLTVSPAATVCTGGSTTLTASGAVSYTWTPALGLNGTTGASVIATPSASTTYSVTGVDANGCTTAAATVAVTVAAYPSALTITQGAASVCTDSVMSLTATGGTVGGAGTATLGTDNATTKINTTAVPYRTGAGVNGQPKNQYLVLASELTTAGITAGNITSLTFVTTAATGVMSNMSFRMANTSTSVLTTTLLTPAFTSVLTLASYTPVVGDNAHAFTTPFAWDGTSNILVETCGTVASGSGCTMATTTTTAITTVGGGASSTGCNDTTGSTITNARPVMKFGYTTVAPTAITWSPTTNLYTTSGASTAYTGGNTNVVYTKPSGAITYTATASNGACTTTATTTVTPIALPIFTLTSNVTICKGQSTTLETVGSGYTYVWTPALGLNGTTTASVSANPTATTTYTVEATDTTTGCKASKSVTVTVSEPGAILSIGTTTTQIAVPGGSTTFTVATASGATYTYQWQVNDGSGFVNLSNNTYYSNVTSATLTISNIEATFDNYQYQCLVTGASPCATLTPIVATLTVSNTGIAQQPANVTLCGATSTSFTIVTNGDDPYGITWQMSTDNGVTFADLVDGADVTTGLTFSGVDQTTLNVSGVTIANSGVKFLCVLNYYLPSNAATLTVKTPVAITTQPADQTVCVANGTATFTTVATGDDLAYQWEVSTNGTTWSNYAGTGATTASISVVNPALVAEGTQYRVVVSGNAACSSVTSSVATLHINNPTITAAPTAATVLRGNTAAFTVAASAATSYQWQRSATLNGTYVNVTDATPTGNTYTGADTATLSVITSATTVTGGGNYYRCVVTNNGCTVTSTGALLTVNWYCTPAPTSVDGTGIINVAMGDINNATVAESGNYGDYTSQSTSAAQLSTVSFGITYATGFTYGTKIWIDYNDNAVFTDSGEQVYYGLSTSTNPTTLSGSFAIPLSAPIGAHRMRIGGSDTDAGVDPCYASSYGTFEDYTINITAAPTCEGSPTAGTATTANTSLCSAGAGTTLTLSGYTTGVTNITLQWYMSTNGTTFAPVSGATTATLATGSLTVNTSYYCAVTCTNTSITVNSNTVSITVNDPLMTGSTPAGRCGTGTVTLGATANAGSTINWYAAVTGGTVLGTGTSFTTPSISATTTYYAEASTVGGLRSASGLGNTSIPTSTGATAERGIVFTASNNGTIVSAQYYSPTLSVTNTVTARLVDNVTGTQVGSSVVLPITQGATAGFYTMNLNLPVTAGTTYRLLASFSSSVNRISSGADYTSAAYNNLGLLGTITSGYDSGVTTASYNYFHNIVALVPGCASARTAVTATVDPQPTATISYAGSPFCNNAAVGSVTLTGTNAYTGGTFTSTSGLGLNGTTGAVDPTTSTPGTYTVTYTTNATTYCTPQTATATVVINESVLTSNFSYASTSYCTNSGTVTPTVTGTAGVFTASPAGLTINASTGAINFATATPGSYTVTNTVTACSNNSTTDFAITVYPAVTIGTQPTSTTVCASSNASMTVAGTGTDVVYQWQMSTNGTSWSNVSDGGAYSGSTAATLAFTGVTTSMSGYQFRALVSDANPCGAVTSSAATLTVSQPAVPTVTASSLDYCSGGIVTLTAGNIGTTNKYANSFDVLPSNFATSTVGTGTPTAVLDTTYKAEGTGSVRFSTTSFSSNTAYSMNANVDLSTASGAQVTFSHQALMEGPTTSYDYGYVEYSADGGTTWVTFPTTAYVGSAAATVFTGGNARFTTKSYADWITNFTGTASLPNNTLWKAETFNVPAAALTSQFRIRFRYTTDSSANYYGWMIDNVKVVIPSTTVWSPVTGLYTNAAATTAYTGTNTATVYAKTSGSASYVLTTANALGCTNTSSVNLNMLAPSTLASIAQPLITCSGAQTTFNLTGLLASSTSTISYTVNGGATQTKTGVVADASGNGSFTLALAAFTNGQTLAVTAIQRTDLTPNCSTAITANNTVVIAVQPLVTYYADADGDTYGNYNVPNVTCQGQPSGYVTNSTDCDDNNAAVHATYSFYADTDSDGYGAGSAVSFCVVDANAAPAGYVTNNTDCNDADATVHAPATYYVDADADGYGSTTTASLCSATAPAGYATNATDCNDSDASVHSTSTYYVDADHDGYGSTTTASLCSATAPVGYSTNSTDCNDSDASVYSTSLYYVDVDADGYDNGRVYLCAATAPVGYSATTGGSDCNDNNASIHFEATYYVDADADGFDAGSALFCLTTAPSGYSAITGGTDCNDAVYSATNTCTSVVNVKLNIQGYYDTATHAMRPVLANQGVGASATDVDDVTVELRNSSTNALVTSVVARLHTDGTAVATFTTAPIGSFYIAVKHRNSLETWSAAPQTVGATPLTYDFTSAANKAYGDNMIQLESGVYGIYSGDINQDGFIESGDYPSLFNDNDAAAEGYLTTDLNGDGFVEASDYPILFNNNDAAIETLHP
jgi:hypothetical protein